MNAFDCYFKAASKMCFVVLLGCLILIPQLASAQNGEAIVKGVVTDEANNFLSAVSVKVKGENKGTLTNDNGQFIISVVPGEVLEFSEVGYENQAVTVHGTNSLQIKMKSVQTDLSTVVVNTGYGSLVRQKDATGSIGVVNMKEAHLAPVKSFDEFLAGRVAGVQVSSVDGQPGSIANIYIRGMGSITQNAGPLYVIDGVPLDDGQNNSIDPENIESLVVLKDASATAIYGARGANGVILITTKRGKTGAPVVTFNSYYGIQAIPKKIPVMNGVQYIQFAQEVNSQITDSAYLKSPLTLASYDTVPSINAQDFIYQTSRSQNNDFSIRGGTENTHYSLSLNYLDQTGIVITTGFKRYQGRVTLDQKVGDKLKFGINSNYSVSNQTGPFVSTANNFYASSGLLTSAWGFTPVPALSSGQSASNLLDSALNPNQVANNNQFVTINPIYNIQHTQTNTRLSHIDAVVTMDYQILKALSFHADGSILNNISNYNLFNDAIPTVLPNSSTLAGAGVTTGTYATISYSTANNWNTNEVLTYDTHFNKDHHFTAMAVFNAYSNKTNNRSMSGTQLPNPDLGLNGLALSPLLTATTNESSNTGASFVGKVMYDYKARYFLTASIRRDGSSKFAPGDRWGTFPAVGANWHFTEEGFIKKLNLFSSGGLRVAYGTSGNSNIGDFTYLPQLSLTNYNWWQTWNGATAVPGATVSNIGNLGLKWEKAKSFNLGLDMGFLQDRITLTTEIYRKTSSNLLLNASIPDELGIYGEAGIENVGSLRNQGLEFTLNTTNIQTKDFTWTTNFNIAFNSNKIIKLTNNQPDLLSNVYLNTSFSGSFPYISAVGNSVGTLYGYKFAGVYQYSDFNVMPNGSYVLKPNLPDDGTARNNIQPGFIKYADLNGDLHIDQNDLTIIGRGLPICIGGFNNDFSYKGFSLNIFFQYNVGNDLINANRYIFEGGMSGNNPFLNQFASYTKRWEPNNPSNTLPKVNGTPNAVYSSRVVESGSYLRLKTVNLSYSLPDNLIRKWGLSKLQIYTSAQNLWTLTKYTGMDPDVSSRPSQLTPGFDYGAYPHSFIITTGLNVSF